VPDVARSLGSGSRKRSLVTMPDVRQWIPRWSPEAAMRAVRAAVVLGGCFAFADQVLGNLQVATFAAFGSFATLVLSSFGGDRREKLASHFALALAGSALLAIGTAVTSSTLLAALVTVPVTFLVFYAGVAGPNAAGGVNGALLAYVLPAASPGTVSMIPDRLAGWWMASVAGTIAVLFFSPRPGPNRLRDTTARVARALAEEMDAALAGLADERNLADTIATKHDLLALLTATPYRPTGLAPPAQALANTVELLEWSTTLLADALRERADWREAPQLDRELLAAAGAVLRDVAALLGGARKYPDLERLERRRDESLAAFERVSPGDAGFRDAARVSFHAHALALAILATGAETLVACGLADAGWVEEQRRRWFGGGTARAFLSPPRRRVYSVATEALRHASLRSVWFVNSLRGALALAAAVAIADVSSVQHGFWVVLGTLSVLRGNAAATGYTVLSALAGTVVGFVIGGALLVAIGATSTALWVVLPLAVGVAAYTPGTAPFAVGQAAFTVTIAVLFNLLAPVGWKVGVLRVEDVAIGCGVSLLVGVLFWPRGAVSVVGDNLADAFRSGAAYLTQAIAWTRGSGPIAPDLSAAAVTTASRVDDGLRGFIAERGTTYMAPEELWRLVGGTMRLRLTARAIAELPAGAAGAGAGEPLAHRAAGLVGWYDRLADTLDRPHGRPVTALEPPSFGPYEVVTATAGSRYGVWLCEHLDHLSEHLDELVQPALDLAALRRRRWWL
jgi:uncharacterized membrane protein YccC